MDEKLHKTAIRH